ncbi:MAG: type II toxin-antitoxin system PemK/MazF family toxin, partial [Bacteroidales bacterium]|nr:type II toxin-antitoxin system PemK/MazF family toxin [Bacteroidales bacterium]
DLPKQSWVKISQIRTLSVERIGKVIGRASIEQLTQIIEGLNEIIA